MALDFSKIKTYSLRSRPSKVKIGDFASLSSKKGIMDFLPDILAAKQFKELVEGIKKAHRNKCPVIFMLGAHVIKCGLSPLVIDLIKRKVVTAVALNGAGIIHDFEIAYLARTSEDVDEAIQNGSFGMAKETAQYLNNAIKEADKLKLGMGEAVGKLIEKEKFRYRNLSIVYAGLKNRIPITVHVALGTDIIHMHPSCDGRATGEATLRDFKKFCEVISQLQGGVIINFGSAVILPEVFLKALSLSRNLGFKVENFTAADFDMIRHYRAFTNVVKRPTLKGRGFSFVGHHEIMIPLLYRAIIDKIKS